MLSNVRGTQYMGKPPQSHENISRSVAVSLLPQILHSFFSMTANITEKQCAQRLYSEHNRICEAAGVTAVSPFKANTYCMRCNRSPVAPVTEE